MVMLFSSMQLGQQMVLLNVHTALPVSTGLALFWGFQGALLWVA
jgi:hypothetical protein